MAKAKTALVIVESPAKARTIEKYLGEGYKVVASMGHLRDLPKSKLGVDLENGFRPDYIPVTDRADIIEDLKKRAASAGVVYLATDPDREGEAISWHLRELLSIPEGKAHRVTFNEITKRVVNESIANPRDIDMDLVDAQQARRILDRIVGYKLSPLLWRKIRRGLSAGRVQSVATRIVVDREREIRDFKPEEYWNLDAQLSREGGEATFTAHYFGTGDKRTELHSEAETEAVKAAVTGDTFTVKSVKRGEKHRSPSPPFITSTLQQEASRRLGMTPRRTMSIAQQLYEGVDIAGSGTVGLITYMRTDSLRLSDEALAAAAALIKERYGESYYAGKPRTFQPKAGAQDAHEAIRPSSVAFTPESVKASLTSEQYHLYRLIWGRFTASQMANAVYNNVVTDVQSAGHVFRANYSELKFPGYIAVYEEKSDEESEQPKKPLPELNEGEELKLIKLTAEQQFTQPPSRYTEATLVRAMEEKGIGRPSTYAPTISTITDREYVIKEGRFLRPTPLGETVNSLMEERFSDIVDLKFTAHMEDSLDKVEEGQEDWRSILAVFYEKFKNELSDAEAALDGVYIKVPDELSEEHCDLCGRQMVVKSGRFGRFLACPGFPECTFTKPLVIEMPGKCPRCGARILKRSSKKGYTYYACEKLKDCGFMTWDVPTKNECPDCGKTMFKLSGKGQKKPFCINPECPSFLPEDKRGYRRKPAATEAGAQEPAGEPEPKDKKPAERKAAAKKTTAKSTAAKKSASKTSTAKKPATKASTARKPAAKKTAAAKPKGTKKASDES